MILYHGTDINSANNIVKHGVRLRRKSKAVDFGPGFYTTDDYDRAVKWGMHKAEIRGTSPAVVKIEFDEASAAPIIMTFYDDIKWAQFVINNRNGHEYIQKQVNQDNNLDARYPITYGRVADINIIGIAKTLLKSGKAVQSTAEILNVTYPMQYVFHTEDGLKYIKCNEVITV